jgi:DNA-directed RNA polymerase specialized sigma24 family protein
VKIGRPVMCTAADLAFRQAQWASADAEARFRLVVAAAAQLPHALKEVVDLCCFRDLSPLGAAAVLGITRRAVDVRLCRARTWFREHFGIPPRARRGSLSRKRSR